MDEVVKRIERDCERLKVVRKSKRTLKADSHFIALEEGTYLLNNGEEIKREHLSKKLGVGSAVCVFAVTQEKKILLVVQPRVTLPTENRMNVEIPAGYIEVGEEAVQAGLRELQEETGYTSSDIILVDSYYPSLGFSGERIDLVLALDCIKTSEQKLDANEFLYCEEVTLEELEYLLNSGYIKDASTRIGYYRYLEYLMKEGN